MAGSGIGQLLKDVGNNLSANEARKIAEATGTTPERVYAVAQSKGVGIAQSAQKQYGSPPATAPTGSNTSSWTSSSTSSSSSSSSGGGGGGGGGGNSGGSGIGQLLKDVGNNLSANEARQIAAQTGKTPEKVYEVAQRKGVGIAPSAQKQYGSPAATAPTSLPSGSAEYDELNQRIQELTSQNYGLTSERDNLAGQLGSYENELSAYASRFTDMQAQYQDALDRTLSAESQLGSARSQAEAEKKRADELEQMRADERELSISQQLGGLRSGSSVSGSGSTGLGSLSSGRSSYSISTGGKSGGVLDRAYQDIDPTDSVLNKDVAVASARSSTGSSSATEARQRALASGGGASSYYAQRFG